MGKQVKTPRFYVDMPTFLHATGQLGWDDNKGGAELLYMNCSNPFLQDTESNTMFMIGSLANNTPKTSFPINFCALLNHNLGSDTNNYNVVGKAGLQLNADGSSEFGQGFSGSDFINRKNVLNYDGTSGINATYNGTTIWTFSDKNGLDKYWRNFDIYFPNLNEVNTPYNYDNYTHQLGSFVVGKYWDAPNSPDMSLTMSRRFDGIKRQKTIGGKTLANIYYDGPTEWTMNGLNGTYKYPPFELDLAKTAATTDDVATDDINEQTNDFNQISKSGLGRKGLKSWKLTFSYISESDMWMANETSNTIIADDTTTTNNDPNPMLSDDSFNFVWNCTLGGTLPFIFQPNAPKYDAAGVMTQGDNSPDQFSICTFRENTLSVTQQAHNVYKLSITIDEVA
jgi:hypothetical protein